MVNPIQQVVNTFAILDYSNVIDGLESPLRESERLLVGHMIRAEHHDTLRRTGLIGSLGGERHRIGEFLLITNTPIGCRNHEFAVKGLRQAGSDSVMPTLSRVNSGV